MSAHRTTFALCRLVPRPRDEEEFERAINELVEAASKLLEREEEKQMSWSLQAAFGKAPAVREGVAKQFENGHKCMEPEESIRLAAAKIIDVALAGQDQAQVVEVSASGSMSTKNGKFASNQLNIAVTPRSGFIE